jgi:hypothetical protein
MDLNDLDRSQGLNLTSKKLAEEMYVASRGNAYRGFKAYRVITVALPAFWPLAPWLFLPGISSLGALVYRFVARNRMQLLGCDSHCPVQPAEESESTAVAVRNGAKRNFSYALMVSGITVVALLCWFYRIEFYPFTSWHLYSALNTTGEIEYYKVLARYESGITSAARLEDGIGALAFDSRYYPFIEQCFGEPSDIHTCTKLLTAEASVYNKKASPGGKITHYEIQQWTWNFRDNPLDPQHGNLAKRFVHQIN